MTDQNYKRMERVKLWEDNLTDAQKKYISEQTKTRYNQFAHLRSRRKNIFALGVAGMVFSIYAYTWRQMSKDRLCDEIDREVQSKLQQN